MFKLAFAFISIRGSFAAAGFAVALQVIGCFAGEGIKRIFAALGYYSFVFQAFEFTSIVIRAIFAGTCGHERSDACQGESFEKKSCDIL